MNVALLERGRENEIKGKREAVRESNGNTQGREKTKREESGFFMSSN